jgi:putative alpha-1,2-mannosidase
MRAKLSNGQFREPFDPASAGYGSDYTEANAWQYSWYVPQDVAGLIGAMGGDKFTDQARPDVRCQGRSGDLQGCGGHHRPDRLVCAWQRTEPPHRLSVRLRRRSRGRHSNGSSRSWTASTVRGRTALIGNDDLGQMSAWYIFTALGFYPVTPASDEYAIGRPFVPRAAIHLSNGHTFTVTADRRWTTPSLCGSGHAQR